MNEHVVHLGETVSATEISTKEILKITAFLNNGDIFGAMAFCDNLLVSSPKSAAIYNVLGIIAAKTNDINKSIHYFNQAINFNPNEAVYHNNLSNALKKQGNLSLAIQHLHQALMLSPNYAEAYNNLGSLYYTEGRIKEAIPYFEKAIRLNPNYWEPHYNLANSLIKEDQVNIAISHYQATLKITPNNMAAKQNLAMAYIATNQHQEALPFLEEAVKNNPEHAEIHAQLAEVYLDIGRTINAIETFERALQLAPKQAVWHHNLAILYLREQQQDQALLHFKEALSYDPNNQTALHMVHALANDSIQNAPIKYVSDLFDQYSKYYNNHVQEKLQYKVPELLRQIISKQLKDKIKALNILDLGCGTGLCSIYFRDLAKYLIGIDLSKEMLAQAKMLNSYDALCRGNIIQSIPGENSSFFDIIISADVLVYCGELDNIFQLCAKALKNNGLFAFTTEKLAHGNYQLQKTGRFAHSYNYILETLKKHGFLLIDSQEINLRIQHDKPIVGMLYLLIKQNISI